MLRRYMTQEQKDQLDEINRQNMEDRLQMQIYLESLTKEFVDALTEENLGFLWNYKERCWNDDSIVQFFIEYLQDRLKGAVHVTQNRR
jgi:hypothetical protein